MLPLQSQTNANTPLCRMSLHQTDFAYWWNSKNNVQISLRERDILYALKPQKRLFQGINYCLLVAKQYIYVAAKNEDLFVLAVIWLF